MIKYRELVEAYNKFYDNHGRGILGVTIALFNIGIFFNIPSPLNRNGSFLVIVCVVSLILLFIHFMIFLIRFDWS